MSSISGIGGQSLLTALGRRAKEREEEQADYPRLTGLTAPTTPTPVGANYDYQAEQAYEEAFAKLRVSMTSGSSESSSLAPSAADAQTDAASTWCWIGVIDVQTNCR